MMNLNAPKQNTFYIALALIVVAFITWFATVFVDVAFFLAVAGFCVLAAGNMVRNL